MAELTNAADMAKAAGIHPETFREALRGSVFAQTCDQSILWAGGKITLLPAETHQ
jgi:hypothetical protein